MGTAASEALRDRLGEADQIDWQRASLDSASVPAPGGAKRQARTRRIKAKRAPSATIVFDGRGVPLSRIHTAANVHDSKVLEEAVDAISPIRKPRGRPRKRPKKLHADKGYDFPRCREALRKRGITFAHRSAGHRIQREAGTIQVDCGTDSVVGEPQPAAEGTLRTA
jgi:hypothetical protein